MTDPRFQQLVSQVRDGKLDRRNFIVRAMALGVGTAAAHQALWAAGVGAQATPEGSPVGTPAAGTDLTPENLGEAGIPHNTDTSGGVINLYSSWPMSGNSVDIGGDSRDAVQLAIDVFGGAAGGFAITYEALDDGLAANQGSWDGPTEASNATKVIDDVDAMAYIATYNSGAAIVSIPLTNQAGLAQISPANTAIQLTKENPANEEGYPEILYPTGTRNYMRVVPSDDLQGGASANFAYNSVGATNVYILHDNQVYGKGIASVFQQTFEGFGGAVAGFEAFSPDAPEYQALATKVADSGADFIYIGAIVNLNASKLLQDIRELVGDDVAIMGPDGLINQAFIDGAGDAANGMYLTFGGLPANELEGVGKAYYDTMVEKLGRDPDPYALYSFECGVVTLQGIDKAGAKDRKAILDAMFSTKDFRGLIGNWSFTETGDTSAGTISLNTVVDGAITFQETIGLAE